MANINKTVFKNTFKDAGIERISASAIDHIVVVFNDQCKLIAEESKVLLDEDNLKTLTVEIIEEAIRNLRDQSQCTCDDC